MDDEVNAVICGDSDTAGSVSFHHHHFCSSCFWPDPIDPPAHRPNPTWPTNKCPIM